MLKSLVIVAFLLMFACYDRKKEAVDSAIRSKESGKGSKLASFTILRELDSIRKLTVLL